MANKTYRLSRWNTLALCALGFSTCWLAAAAPTARAQSRFATSDSQSGYVHWIDLYDASNKRIDPNAENPAPYSPEKTCGRCHEFDTISHGWHFNAVEADADSGRPGQPWIWSDERTGTHLPLSYRGWLGTFDPDKLGLSRWQVAAKLGGFLPGGGPGSAESLAPAVEQEPPSGQTAEEPTEEAEESEAPPVGYEDRTNVTGSLPVDCMICHRNVGSGYSPFVWTEQIEEENFAYAPTAALGIAVVSGNSRRLKDDFDPTAEGAAEQLPKVEYQASRFRSDGKVFFDLIRKPDNGACYYCHTNVPASTIGGSRWLHDEDVHVRAGIACADCHRNGLDHHTIRGFEGEQHLAGTAATSLSCQGCHLGNDAQEALALPGRLGAPKPQHKGLPPLHFEKMSCTACHSGSMPQDTAPRILNSIAHRLGEHIKRTGSESPAIVGPVPLPLNWQPTPPDIGHEDADNAADPAHAVAGKYTPQRLMWPAYWAILKNDTITPLNPAEVYDLIRRPLKVRREFTAELEEVKLSLTQRKTILGDDRARVKEDEWTQEEQAKIAAAEAEERALQVGTQMSAALAAVEEAYPDTQAVYISGGSGFIRDGEEKIAMLDADKLADAAKPYAWPAAHNVRPARQSLGVNGCTDCHSDGSLFFATEVLPVGTLPEQEVVAVKLHQMQGVDVERLDRWNSLFQGRSLFKIAGLIALGLTCLIVVSACAINLSDFWKARSAR